ncbi:zinc ribbon domain-containing protein [Flavobacterium aciduliphilum]|uniref:Zinc-ribbon domain-containing protein n=1 Tax=Flavobacterium aciduliphilum TaxID=1101402 RepID=A0A328YKF3_9FLAO|nr:zinc ribbon domain-containing protein [Flavobacterium aciduliphilum]RAR72552.1 hypothetical protein CLV55_105122 [Flavobacterium aciduliphilum]
MGLIFCSECGEKVSEFADKCIKCGFPLYKQIFKPSIEYKKSSNTQSDNGMIIAGYIVSFFSLFVFPIVFLIAGVTIGILNISKGEKGHGTAQIVISILFGTIGMFLSFLSLIFNLFSAL